MQIIINRPDGGQSVITNPPEKEKLNILVSPQEIEIQEVKALVLIGIDKDGEDVFEEKITKIKTIKKEAEYRQETDEEWLDRIAEQALENCRHSFGEGDYSYEIINNK